MNYKVDARVGFYGWWAASMATPANDQARLRFSIFEVDLVAGELRRHGLPLRLQEKPFQILALLLERPGEIVTREELQRRLWPNGTFVDFDKGLNTAMKKLRQTLGDSADAPVFIETVPRRGYRFIAPAYADEPFPISPAEIEETDGELPTTDPGNDNSVAGKIEIAPPVQLAKPYFLYLAVAFAILSITTAAAWFWISRKPSLSVENMRITPVTRNGNVRHMAISPDGKYVVFALRNGIYQSLWVHDILNKNEVQLLAPDTVNFPGIAISPNSRFVYFARSETTNPYYSYMCRVAVTGGPVERLVQDADSSAGFSPDGSQFVFTRGFPNKNVTEVRIANADGSNDHLLRSMEGHQVFEAGPTWSPQNDVIAVPIHSIGQQSRFALYAISLRNAQSTELVSWKGSIGRPLWLASGHELLVTMEDEDSHRGQLWTVSYPEARMRRFTNDLSDYSSAIDKTLSGSKLAAIVKSRVSDLWTVPIADPLHPVQITSGEPSLFQVDELPNGKLLARGEEIWVMNSNGSTHAPLSAITGPGVEWIEPCGPSIVALVRREGNAVLMHLESDGTRPAAIASGDLQYPSCSADGKNIYFFNFASPEKVHRIPAEGGSSVEIANVLGITIAGNLAVSPDGKLLAYLYQQYSPPLVAIAVIPSAGGPPLKTFQVPGSVGRLRWSPDGKALDYFLTQNNATNIWEQNLSGGLPKKITAFDVGQAFDFSRSRDGKRLLMARGQSTRDIVLLQNFQRELMLTGFSN